jgi:hypothetical protein
LGVSKDNENPTNEPRETGYQAKGGNARAQALSPEQRQEIAKKAAEARWQSDLPKATHSGELTITGVEGVAIPCHVLENGERILSTRGIMKSLGRSWRGRKYGGTQLPVFLEANNLKPFITSEMEAVLEPVLFQTKSGAKGEGYRAEILPTVCEVYLEARQKDALKGPQLTVAQQCEVLVRGFSRIGIIALVDEATGYQEVRDRQALQAILDMFLEKEFAAWAKRFPDEFYKEMFRLRNWKWESLRGRRPPLVGVLTNDLVYDRLAPGLLEELKSRNPKDEKGNRRAKHHQWLTFDVGHPALAQHLYALITLMRVSTSWTQFKGMLNHALPKRGKTLALPFGLDED